MDKQALWALVPALDLVDLTLQTCLDLLAQSIPVRVLLIDQGSSEESNDQFRQFAEQHHPRVLLWSFNPPLPSLSGAWNRGLAFVWSLGVEEALVVNSDTRLWSGTAALLLEAQRTTGAFFVTALGVTEAQFAAFCADPGELDVTARGGPDFSCFLGTRAWHTKYQFDESFIPAFMEDLDMDRRVILGGDGERIFSVNVPFHHIGGGSRTINQSDAARQAFERQAGIGRRYYQAKWKGQPNQETCLTPFGLHEPPHGAPYTTTPDLRAFCLGGLRLGDGTPVALGVDGELHTVAADPEVVPL